MSVSQELGGAFNVEVNKSEPVRLVLTWQSTLDKTSEQKTYDDGSYEQETYRMPFDPQPFATTYLMTEVGNMTKSGNSVTYDFAAPQVDCGAEFDWAPSMVYSHYDDQGALSFTDEEQRISVGQDSIIDIYIRPQ